MAYSCTDFVDTILDALGIVVPEKWLDSPDKQADLALKEIEKLKAAALSKIFIVEGVSAVVPGRVMKAFSSEQAANAEAADLVNLIRQQGRMRGTRATAENWRSKLSQVQVAREWEETATVEITELEVGR